MKKTPLALLLTAVTLFAASQPALAATKKADGRAAELVAALQAVSPDPLGGRLGLAAASTNTAVLPAPKATGRDVAVSTAASDADRRAYLLWKSAQKS